MSATSGQDLDILRRRFAEWMSVPASRRVPANQTKWAQENGVSRETVSRWKRDPDFKRDVADAGLDQFSANDLNDIILALKMAAKKGNVPAAKLCLQMAGVIDDGRKAAEEVPTSPEEMATLTDDDLARLAAGEGLT